MKKYLATVILLTLSLSLVAQRPALVPLPQKIEWQEGAFKLPENIHIELSNDSILPVAEHLKDKLARYGTSAQIGSEGIIQFEIVPMVDLLNHQEAYNIAVTQRGVRVQAATLHGLFNAVQTLDQLILEDSMIPLCEISDAPAFSWRGYMVDVGRNYQSMELLREQIEVMAALKLNLFHFHLTEDVAWRLRLNSFPDLTAPEHMTRDHGLYYTEDQIKELQSLCEELYITFMLEIDMPGHSAAFTRATGYDMQSPEGLEIVLKILDEVTTRYNFQYLHIGADEVKITNKDFLPTVAQFLEERGITVVGWQPGGNLPTTAWRQLWSEAATEVAEAQGLVQIDSRNLYVNHMDALECVPSIFNHQVCDVPSETPTKKGATLCLWNDRRLRRGEDNLRHNPLYPAMFVFAERLWQGGGKPGSYVGVDSRPDRLSDFREFEDRMMQLRERSFGELDFPYVPQADIEWSVLGPYDNQGDLARQFHPEKVVDLTSLRPDTTLVGGTIVWQHFWNPIVKGHYTDLPENSTFYAYRRVWSDEGGEVDMWIGFNDFSRSYMTDSPKLGTWNNLGSKIWINGEEIAPPRWRRAGERGDMEYPYEDENYIMRSPQRVRLRKGWNDLLVKCPISTFATGIWYAPNKWMFTAVILE
ncbi:MAG: family 20 glycosylhydrolase [Porphyromonas sp.]|nr:family 20 glycosylhydrolase [Porphyromonas sp.]